LSTNQEVFIHWEDPGHGWVEVKKTLLKELGIADKITGYSYMKGEYAYLEEDCDAMTFYNAYLKAFGKKPKFETEYCDYSHYVRHYPGYSTA
jgi:hypothetical protein